MTEARLVTLADVRHALDDPKVDHLLHAYSYSRDEQADAIFAALPAPYEPESYMGGMADMAPVKRLDPLPESAYPPGSVALPATAPARFYAPIYLNGGGDPSFAQIDAFLRTHFNAHAEYNAAAPAEGLRPHVGHILGVIPPDTLICDTCEVEIDERHYMGDDCTEEDGAHFAALARHESGGEDRHDDEPLIAL